jgi:hypothetical protein
MKNYLLFSFFCVGCTVLSQSTNETPVLYIEKSACYGECPVYKTEIFVSGKMTFHGISNTKLNGFYCANIDKKDLTRLIDAFKQQNYFAFNEVYFSHAKDLPTTTTNFNYDGKQKRVRDYDKAPPELKQLEKMLETLSDTTSWKTCK